MRKHAWSDMLSHFLGLFPVLCAGILIGCGTMANGRGWGQDASLAPGWDRVGQAAWKAATSASTWVPAGGALVFQIGHADRNLQQWAAREVPLYGSQQRAERMSNDLRDAAGILWVASGVAAPGGDTVMDWTVNKSMGFGIQLGAGILTRETVGQLKATTDRTRPNGIDKDSFPSAHATGAALYSTFASRNIEALHWSPVATTASQIGLGALTTATAWARVEANQHFPSDVLGGMAIGHFFGAFFTDAFMGLDNPRNAMVLIEPSREGATAMIRFNF